MKTLERNPFETAKVKFGRFLDVAEIENLSPLERMRYEEKLKSYRDYVNTISFAEEKGIMKGLLQGKREIAFIMKQKGYPIDMIADSTGLTPEEIDRLKEL